MPSNPSMAAAIVGAAHGCKLVVASDQRDLRTLDREAALIEDDDSNGCGLVCLRWLHGRTRTRQQEPNQSNARRCWVRLSPSLVR